MQIDKHMQMIADSIYAVEMGVVGPDKIGYNGVEILTCCFWNGQLSAMCIYDDV